MEFATTRSVWNITLGSRKLYLIQFSIYNSAKVIQLKD